MLSLGFMRVRGWRHCRKNVDNPRIFFCIERLFIIHIYTDLSINKLVGKSQRNEKHYCYVHHYVRYKKQPNRLLLEFDSDIIMLILCSLWFFFSGCRRFRPIDIRNTYISVVSIFTELLIAILLEIEINLGGSSSSTVIMRFNIE